MSIKHRAQQYIRDHRRSAPFAWLAKASNTYLRHWYNEHFYDMDKNGEAFALKQFAAWSAGRALTVWDVGAHRGEWSDFALDILTRAQVHSFEVIPEIAADIGARPRRTVHNIGLSEASGEFEIYRAPGIDTLNTFKPYLDDPNFAGAVKVPCKTERGDAVVDRIGMPDLIKIDTEGHDVAVLRGCEGLIKGPNPPAMFQVEYGVTYIQAGAKLLDVYSLLPGYAIGRLYADHVDFKPYDYADEHHRMGNMIAVRDPELQKMLANA